MCMDMQLGTSELWGCVDLSAWLSLMGALMERTGLRRGRTHTDEAMGSQDSGTQQCWRSCAGAGRWTLASIRCADVQRNEDEEQDNKEAKMKEKVVQEA